MNEELRQQLWDLVYGLLEPDEAAALKAKITSDPAIARLYAEIRLQQDLVADAARIEVAPITLAPQTKVAPAAAAGKNLAARTNRETREKLPRSSAATTARWVNIAVGLSAVVLVGLFATSLMIQSPQPQLAQGGPGMTGATTEKGLKAPPAPPAPPEVAKATVHERSIITEVRGPQTVVPGLTQHFVLSARTADDQPASAHWNVRYMDEDGEVCYAAQVQTNELGESDIAIPGDVLRQSGQLLVDRLGTREPQSFGYGAVRDEAYFLQVPVQVARENLFAHLEVDRPIARPGETVGFRTVVLGEESHVASEAIEAQFELFDADGKPVPGTISNDVTHLGVAAADAILPSNTPDGVYELAVRSPNGEFSEQRTRLLVRRDGGASILALEAADRDQLELALQESTRGIKDAMDQKQAAAPEPRGFAADANRKRLAESSGANYFAANAANGAAPAAPLERGLEKSAPGASPAGPENAPAPPPAPAPAVVAPVPPLQEVSPTAPAAPDVVEPQAATQPPIATAPLPNNAFAGGEKPSKPGLTGRAMTKGEQATKDAVDETNEDKSQGGGGFHPGSSAAAGGGQGRGGANQMVRQEEKLARGDKSAVLGKAVKEQEELSGALQVLGDEEQGVRLQLEGIAAGAKTIVVTNESGLQIAKADVAEAQTAASQAPIAAQAEKKLKGLNGRQRFMLALPPEAEGSLHIEVIDHDQDRVVAETNWSRPARRWANVRIDSQAKEYAAGDEVELELLTNDEKGDPLSAVLGVRVFNAELEQIAENTPPVNAFALGALRQVRRNANAEQESLANAAGRLEAKVEGQLAADQADRAVEFGKKFAERSAGKKEADEKEAGEKESGEAKAGVAPAAQNFAPAAKPGADALGDGSRAKQQAAKDEADESWREVYTQAEPRFVVLARKESTIEESLPEAPAEVKSEGDAVAAAGGTVLTDSVVCDMQHECAEAARLMSERKTGRLLMAAGWIGLLGVGVAFMMRCSLKAWAWLPAVAASMVCLAVGFSKLPDATRTLTARRQEPAATPSVPAVAPRESQDDRRELEEAPKAVESTAFPPPGGAAENQLADLVPADGHRASGALAKNKTYQLEELRQREPMLAAKADAEKYRGMATATTSVPVTLFWNPRLVTDTSGKAKIRFQLPPQAGKYRVLVDAHADGRLGQAETVIVSQSAEAAEEVKPAAATPENSEPRP